MATCSLASLARCSAAALYTLCSLLARVSSTSRSWARTSILDAWVVASFSRKPTLALYLSSQSTWEYNYASLTLLSLDNIISCCKKGT